MIKRYKEFAPRQSSSRPPELLVIMLHGYGSNGLNLADLAPEWARYVPQAHFIAPDAPFAFELSHMTGSFAGFQWFSLSDISERALQQGLQQASPIIIDFISNQMKRLQVPLNRLVLMGFSQGGMLSLHAGLSLANTNFNTSENNNINREGVLLTNNDKASPLGIMCFSGMLVGQPPASLNKSPNILMVHGDMDNIVPFTACRRSRIALRQQGLKVQALVEKGIGHTITPRAIQAGGRFLRNLISEGD